MGDRQGWADCRRGIAAPPPKPDSRALVAVKVGLIAATRMGCIGIAARGIDDRDGLIAAAG